MNCDRCGDKIPNNEEIDCFGQVLCGECLIPAHSPVGACGPWSVRGYQKLSQMYEGYPTLSTTQENILRILRRNRRTNAYRFYQDASDENGST